MSFFFTRPSSLKPHEGDTVHVVSELWNQMLSQNKAELVLLILLFKGKLCFFPHMTLRETLKLVKMFFFHRELFPFVFAYSNWFTG